MAWTPRPATTNQVDGILEKSNFQRRFRLNTLLLWNFNRSFAPKFNSIINDLSQLYGIRKT